MNSIDSKKLLKSIKEKIKLTSPTAFKNKILTSDKEDDSEVNDKLKNIKNAINEINMKILVYVLSQNIKSQPEKIDDSKTDK